MIMNTNPLNEPKPYGEDTTWQAGYFHECMSGFEHQVASHMMAEGLVDEALIITRTIHDRYHAAKRNPFNEIECSDHYARAMASYGTFITACGFEYHGPKRYIRFAPKLSPDDFKAPFTAAQGWGTYAQQRQGRSFKATLMVRFGKLELKEMGVALLEGVKQGSVTALLSGRKIPCRLRQSGANATVILEEPQTIVEGEVLQITIG